MNWLIRIRSVFDWSSWHESPLSGRNNASRHTCRATAVSDKNHCDAGNATDGDYYRVHATISLLCFDLYFLRFSQVFRSCLDVGWSRIWISLRRQRLKKIVILIWIYGGRFLFELWGWIACRLFRLFQRTQRHVCPTWFSRYIQRYYTRVLWFSRHNWRYIRFGKQLTRIGIQEDVHVKMTANAFWCYLRWL